MVLQILNIFISCSEVLKKNKSPKGVKKRAVFFVVVFFNKSGAYQWEQCVSLLFFSFTPMRQSLYKYSSKIKRITETKAFNLTLRCIYDAMLI